MRQFNKKWLSIVFLIVGLNLTCCIPFAHAEEPPMDIKSIDLNLESGEIAFSFLNLDDGEATLVQNENKNILINTGSSSSREQLKSLLKVYKAKEISTVVLTNDSPSYKGNLQWLINHYNVKHVVTSLTIKNKICRSNASLSSSCFLIQNIDEKKDAILPEIHVELLSEASDGTLNLLMNFGKHHIVYLGYNDEKKEEELAKKNLPSATILKIGNYGEEPVMNSDFLDKLDPQIAVIFHSHDHSPSEKVLSQLEIQWMDLYQTQQIGCVTVKMNPKTYDVYTFVPQEKKKTEFSHLLHFIYKMITIRMTD